MEMLLSMAVITLNSFIHKLDLLIINQRALLETHVAGSALASLSALGAHSL